jgi:hypothetical protein
MAIREKKKAETTMVVLASVRAGVNRPGTIERGAGTDYQAPERGAPQNGSLQSEAQSLP